MIGVVEGVAVIGAIILIGYVCARLGAFGEETANALTRVAFYVATPAILFRILAHADLRIILSDYMLVAAVSAAAAAVLYLVLSLAFFRRGAGETAIGAASVVFLNSNNMGLPVAMFVLDDPQAIAAVLVLQPIAFTPVLMAVLDGTSGRPLSLGRIVTQPLRNPVVAASATGVAISLSGIRLPDVVEVPLDLLADAAIPVVLLAFGVSLRGRRVLEPGSDRLPIVVATVIKAIIMPLVAWVVAGPLLGLDPAIVFATVVIAALPTGQVVYTYAERFGKGVVHARDVVLLTTVVAVPVLFLAAALLHPS
ncbi:AEC family transporter [Protaetiibacter sp. SSC-01]|uniref:AEC family transporter n=1 Tax=Protaetiibacter sp. SSC-01 TaxID=2759943 RepID=UPI001656D011|nr:AEC family transporter [Protaetiibacter sp. SSC-01]QNO36891.1 AEC family transporter [Protaetiibacter sp. SSC-01]